MKRTSSGRIGFPLGLLLSALLLARAAPCDFLILLDGNIREGKIKVLPEGPVLIEGDHFFYTSRTLARICRESTPDAAAEAWTQELRAATTRAAQEGWLPLAKFYMRQGDAARSLEAATAWAEAREWKVSTSTYFLILTDAAPKRVEEVRARLDAIYQRFQVDFKPAAPPGRESVVRLFKDDFGYRNYCQQKGVSGAGAFYDPALGELVLRDYSEIDKGFTFQSVFHEANHQYMGEHYLKRTQEHTWVSEGLAGYYETAVFKNRRITEVGKIHREHMDEVRQAQRDGMLTPLKTFLRMSRREFYGNDPKGLNYPQAWALVHFFMHTKDKSMRAAFYGYLDGYRAGKSAEEAFDESFGKVGVEKIEAAWRGYMKELR